MGQLAGGLYGVNLGRMFFGESMFAHRTDASKIALAALVAFCRANGIPMIDCQQATPPPGIAGRAWNPAHRIRGHHPACGGATAGDWTYDRGLWAQLGIEVDAAPTHRTQ